MFGLAAFQSFTILVVAAMVVFWKASDWKVSVIGSGGCATPARLDRPSAGPDAPLAPDAPETPDTVPLPELDAPLLPLAAPDAEALPVCPAPLDCSPPLDCALLGRPVPAEAPDGSAVLDADEALPDDPDAALSDGALGEALPPATLEQPASASTPAASAATSAAPGTE
jgi:hypothetical protein